MTKISIPVQPSNWFKSLTGAPLWSEAILFEGTKDFLASSSVAARFLPKLSRIKIVPGTWRLHISGWRKTFLFWSHWSMRECKKDVVIGGRCVAWNTPSTAAWQRVTESETNTCFGVFLFKQQRVQWGRKPNCLSFSDAEAEPCVSNWLDFPVIYSILRLAVDRDKQSLRTVLSRVSASWASVMIAPEARPAPGRFTAERQALHRSEHL